MRPEHTHTAIPSRISLLMNLLMTSQLESHLQCETWPISSIEYNAPDDRAKNWLFSLRKLEQKMDIANYKKQIEQKKLLVAQIL